MKKSTMLKLAGAVFAIAIYVLGFVNGEYYAENKTELAAAEVMELSDEELVELKVADEWGSGLQVVIQPCEDEDFIAYVVYDQDGDVKYAVKSNRDWLQRKYGAK